jgi:hypothetical protein
MPEGNSKSKRKETLIPARSEAIDSDSLAEKNGLLISRLARRMIQHREVAQESAQEVWAKILRSLKVIRLHWIMMYALQHKGFLPSFIRILKTAGQIVEFRLVSSSI